jgi:hypothetical protein
VCCNAPFCHISFPHCNHLSLELATRFAPLQLLTFLTVPIIYHTSSGIPAKVLLKSYNSI